MKAIHLTAYGNPVQNLQMGEVPEPNAPSAGEALVRMDVESPAVSKQIQNATGGMPISLGLDAVGGPAAATIASALSPGA